VSEKAVKLSSLGFERQAPLTPEEEVAYLLRRIERLKARIILLEDSLEYKHLLVDRCLEAAQTNGWRM
jgi:hypothetical protein